MTTEERVRPPDIIARPVGEPPIHRRKTPANARPERDASDTKYPLAIKTLDVLSFAPAPDTRIGAIRRPTGSAGEGTHRVTRRVLIVEDEKNIVESLTFLLGRAGFAIAAVMDGTAALQRIRDEPPDVVILDVNLPGTDGFDILRAVRATPETRDLPVVMLTARMQQQDRRTAEDIGATEFIAKPFSNAHVVDTVKRLIDP